MNGKALFLMRVMGKVCNMPYDVSGDVEVPGTVFNADNPAFAALDYVVAKISEIGLRARFTSGNGGYLRIGATIVDPATIQFLSVMNGGTLVEAPTDYGPEVDEDNTETEGEEAQEEDDG